MTALRVQVVVSPHEKLEFAEQARRDGESLSEWLRRAGQERLETRRKRKPAGRGDLEELFTACDAREQGREPDWEDHLRVIGQSLATGRSDS